MASTSSLKAVLVVDDDPVQRRLLEAALSKAGHRVLTADSGEAALAIFTDGDRPQIDAIVLDLVMPGIDGIETLARLRAIGVEVPVIVQTAQGGIETVVRAMRGGAFDFVVKPVSPERLQGAVMAALKAGDKAVAERVRPGRPVPAVAFAEVVTAGPSMERALKLARKAASSDIPLLIEGESGVGKELVARAIQSAGSRRARPFVTVNCGAIPENLIESILFGHEKGSFTGATEKHVGKFVEANGGTLFLDEVGDLPLAAQVKLLRAIQEGEVDPVGGRVSVKVDIRLISATHRDLIQLVKDGRFREDLYYRLNVFPIMVPPLRDRRDDIPHLVQHFIARLAASEGARVRGISAKALEMLCAHDWPGNIRQLQNAIFRAIVLCEGEVLTVADFPQIRALVDGGFEAPGDSVVPDYAGVAVPVDLRAATGDTSGETSPGTLVAIDQRGNVRPLAEIENEMILLAIDHYQGQMSEVARRLGIGRSTLYRKLKELGIEPETERGERVAS